MSLNLANPIDGFLVSDTIITIDGLLPMYNMGTIINNKLVAARAGVVTPDGGLNYAELAFYSYSDVQLYAIQNPIQCTDTGYYTFSGRVVPFVSGNLKASILSENEYSSFIKGWNNLRIITENLDSEVTFSGDGEECESSKIYLEQGQYITFWQIVEPQQIIDGCSIYLKQDEYESPGETPEVECGVFKFFKVPADLEKLVNSSYPSATLKVGFKVQMDESKNKKITFVPCMVAKYSSGGFETGDIEEIDSSQIYQSFLGGERRINSSLSFEIANGKYKFSEDIKQIEQSFDESHYWLRIHLAKSLELSYAQNYLLKIIIKRKNGDQEDILIDYLKETDSHEIETMKKNETTAGCESSGDTSNFGSWRLSFKEDADQTLSLGQRVSFYLTAETTASANSNGALTNFQTKFGSTWIEISKTGETLPNGKYTVEFTLIPAQNCSFSNFYNYAKSLPSATNYSEPIQQGSMVTMTPNSVFSDTCWVSIPHFYAPSSVGGVSLSPAVVTNGQMRKSPVFIKFKNITTKAEAEALMEKARIVITDFNIQLMDKSCLCKGTKISMADGTLKNIEDIQINDLVMSDQGPTRVYKIEDTITPGYHTLHYFEDGTIIDEGYDHNFFNVEQGFSAPLKSWTIGEHAQNLFEEQIALIKSEDVGGAVPCYGIWTESGTYYANGLLSADSRKNITLMEEFNLEDGVRLLERLSPQDVISTLFF